MHHLDAAPRRLDDLPGEARVLRLVEVEPAAVARRELGHRGLRQDAREAHVAGEVRRGDAEDLGADRCRRGGLVAAALPRLHLHVRLQRGLLHARRRLDGLGLLDPLMLQRGLEDGVLAEPPSQGHEVPIDLLEDEALHQVEGPPSLSLVHRPECGRRVHAVAIELGKHEFALAQEDGARGVSVVDGGGLLRLAVQHGHDVVDHRRRFRSDGRVGLRGRER
mmetsp:Transcript_23660/g.67323  ORF Transcript_23660/g.67323 Transcript_23660/m.67323 type:complete len:221 (-) Transcript_23660:1100-1762(-)